MRQTRRRQAGPGRPPGETAERTKGELVRAGLEAFAEDGYSAASTRAILSSAGVTAPALYHHFTNKAGLFNAVAEHVNDILVEELSAAVETGRGDLSERLQAFFDRSADIQAKNRSLVRFLMTAPIELRRHADLRPAVGQMQRVLDLLREVCHEHAGPGVDAEAATRAAHVVLFGLARMASTATPAEYRQFVAAASRMLAGPPFRAA